MSSTTNSQQQNVIIGPGQELRQAREAQGMSLEEVATKLFINKQRVIDIENDDYSKISSLIYARGYLRAYAKLVGLLEDDVLKKFCDLGLQDEKIHANLDIIASPRTRNKQRTYVRLVNIAIIVVLVLLVVLWWQGKKRVASNQQVSFKNPVQQVIIPSPINSLS